MINQPSNLNSEAVPSNPLETGHDAIDLQQWQLEIDNFIDETSNELNELARMLESGPVNHFAAPPANLQTPHRELPARKTEPSRPADRPATQEVNEEADSTDRLASLRRKFASRLGKQKDTDQA